MSSTLNGRLRGQRNTSTVSRERTPDTFNLQLGTRVDLVEELIDGNTHWLHLERRPSHPMTVEDTQHA